MSVASNCSIIYYTPKGGGYFFFLNWRGVLWKSGGVTPPLGGSRNIPDNKLQCNRPSSRLGRFNRLNLSVYENFLNPGSLLVNRLCTLSIASMSCLRCGDDTIELYSTSGLTYTRKARTSKLGSRDTNARWMAFARWCAFATIASMCVTGRRSWFKSFNT